MFSANTSQVAAGGGVNYIEDVFSTYLYTGNGSTQTITNGIDLSTKGGLLWMKSRSAVAGHMLYDTASNATLRSDSTSANSGYYPTYINPTSSGFFLDASAGGGFNTNAVTYASWTFREQPKFFDVVTWTGNGTAGRTISHNLGSEPGCIIVKQTSGTEPWAVYHRSLGNNALIYLNETDGQFTPNTTWNTTSPTSTNFTVGSAGVVNTNGATYVAYLFAHNAGGFGLTGTDNVISCGSFTTTAGGAYSEVSLGYEPQWVLIKTTSTTNDWMLFDNMRGMTASLGGGALLTPNSSAQEFGGYSRVIPTATGFYGASGLNASADYIYIAIRRGPMKVPEIGTSVFKPNATSAAAGTVVTTNFPVDLEIGNFLDNYDNKPFTDRLRGYATSTSSRTGAPFINSVNALGELTTGAPFSYNWWNKSVIIGNYISEYRQVSYYFGRAPNFFDVVCYDGTGLGSGNAKSHNLGVVPELMIVKRRSATDYWMVYSSFTGKDASLYLNVSNASFGTGGGFWGDGSTTINPTASVFYVGDRTELNSVGSTYVAYLFATCAGVSKVGNYTGNGSTQTINCGFGAGGARFVLIKRTNAAGDWYVYDSSRGMTVVTDPYLRLNTNEPEVATLGSVTTVSTGFALNSAILAAINVNGGTYIFLAIA